MSSWSIAIIAFLAIITIASYFFLRNRSGEKLTQGYLLTITIKILLSCAFVLTFIISDKANADYNAIFFIIGYFVFTAAEVISLLLKSKPKKRA